MSGIRKFITLASATCGPIFFIIGLPGMVEDIATWKRLLTPFVPNLTDDGARWIFSIFGLLLILSLLPWRAIRLALFPRSAKEPKNAESHRLNQTPNVSSYDDDFSHFAALKETGMDSTYTVLTELYRKGVTIREEYGNQLEHMFDHEDNPPSDDQADQWAIKVYRELDSRLPHEAFKFCSDGHPSINNLSDFKRYMDKLNNIIVEYGDRRTQRN